MIIFTTRYKWRARREKWMLGNYIPMAVMMAVAAIIAVGMVAGSALLGPKHPTKYKQSPYECGMTPVGSARERFPIKFYLIAMLFIIFDIETIFLYPWAVIYMGRGRGDQIFLLVEMAIFVAILLVGYCYIYRIGALDWDEGQQGESDTGRPIYRSRPPIRFGNENSGAVRLGNVREVPAPGSLPTRENEDSRSPAPAPEQAAEPVAGPR